MHFFVEKGRVQYVLTFARFKIDISAFQTERKIKFLDTIHKSQDELFKCTSKAPRKKKKNKKTKWIEHFCDGNSLNNRIAHKNANSFHHKLLAVFSNRERQRENIASSRFERLNFPLVAREFQSSNARATRVYRPRLKSRGTSKRKKKAAIHWYDARSAIILPLLLYNLSARIYISIYIQRVLPVVRFFLFFPLRFFFFSSLGILLG